MFTRILRMILKMTVRTGSNVVKIKSATTYFFSTKKNLTISGISRSSQNFTYGITESRNYLKKSAVDKIGPRVQCYQHLWTYNLYYERKLNYIVKQLKKYFT
jgi:hypothetical protein